MRLQGRVPEGSPERDNYSSTRYVRKCEDGRSRTLRKSLGLSFRTPQKNFRTLWHYRITLMGIPEPRASSASDVPDASECIPARHSLIRDWITSSRNSMSPQLSHNRVSLVL